MIVFERWIIQLWVRLFRYLNGLHTTGKIFHSTYHSGSSSPAVPRSISVYKVFTFIAVSFFSLSTRNIAHRFSILRIQVNCLLFMTRQYSMKIYQHAYACIKLTVSLFVRKLGRKASNLKKKSTKLATFDFSFGKNYLTNRQRLQHTPHLYQIAPEGSFFLVGGNEGRQKPVKIKLTIPYEIFCRQIIQTN